VKCHETQNNNNNNEGHSHKGHMSHMWLMVLCCAIPLLLLFALPLLKVNNPNLKGLLSGAIFFLCPLLHLLMMPLMFRKDKNKKEDHGHQMNNQIEANRSDG
ncbi:MAG: hypothetical protein AB7G87_14785, partial [Clostridia bacterium]